MDESRCLLGHHSKPISKMVTSATCQPHVPASTSVGAAASRPARQHAQDAWWPACADSPCTPSSMQASLSAFETKLRKERTKYMQVCIKLHTGTAAGQAACKQSMHAKVCLPKQATLILSGHGNSHRMVCLLSKASITASQCRNRALRPHYTCRSY